MICVIPMSRPLRIEFPGAVYHITSRGNASATDEGQRVRSTFLSKHIIIAKILGKAGGFSGGKEMNNASQ